VSDSNKVTRRTAVQLGLGAAGVGFVSRGLLASTPTDADADCSTPAQAEGPFYPTRDQLDEDGDLTRLQGRLRRATGDVIRIRGLVMDESYQPVSGALVEIWQANRHGRYHHEDDPNPAPLDPDFQGWGEVRTDGEGRYAFTTIVPGAYPVDEDWWRPPHIHFRVARRGFHELTTQMYFAGHELNEKDHLLREISDEERGRVVVALAPAGPQDEPGSRVGTFNIVIRRVRKS
jgi:protocatechuate 3,4-dioxygenase, beta subunit